MNVVQVPRRFVKSDWGGTETVILETCKRLPALGHSTEIVCPNALAPTDVEWMEGVKVTRFPYFYPYLGLSSEAKRKLDQKGGNLFSFSLMRALKQYPGLDLIHLHTAKRLGGIARHVARKRRIPYIVSLHGGLYDVPQAEAETWVAPTRGSLEWGRLLGYWVGSRRVMDDASAIICVGDEEQRRTQRKFPGKRVIHLPNGVDAGRYESGDGKGFRFKFGIPSDRRVVLVVGRIDPQKNQLFLVRCFRRLRELHSELHLLLIGHVTNDHYHRQLESEIVSRELTDSVTVIRGLEPGGKDLVDAYHAANIFVLPSVHEPFGIVILEAWASGLPVVASRVGGVCALVSDGTDGILVNPQREEEFLAALKGLIEEPGKASALAASGRAKACQQYSWDQITRHLAQLYEEVARENPVRK